MTTLLLGILSASVSVSLLLSALLALKKPLLSRYRANALWLVGLLLVALLLCPWRPSLLPARGLGPLDPRQEGIIPSWTSLGASRGSNAAGVEIEDVPVAVEASAAAVVQPVAPRIAVRWDALLFGLWLAGALVALGSKAVRHARFSRLCRRWRQPLSGPARAVLANECAALGMRMPPAWRMPMITSPMVVGLFRPALCVPDAEIPDDQLALMLRHELLHIRRCDLLGVALIELALCVHWFNPLLIWARRQMSALCELACDEAVLKDCDDGKRALYLRAMLAALPGRGRLPLSTRFDGGVKNMKYRMGRLFDVKPRKTGVAVVICVLLLALLTGNVLAVAGTEAGEERLPASVFARESERMTDEEYEFVMGLRLPNYEQMSVADWQAHLQPSAAQLFKLFGRRSLENDFQRMLAWDLDDIQHAAERSVTKDHVATPTLDHVDGPSTFKYLSYTISWQIQNPEQITVARRNEVIRRARRETCMAFSKYVSGVYSEADLRADLEGKMALLRSEPDGELMDVMLTIDEIVEEPTRTDSNMPEALEAELLSLQVPGYLDMSVQDFDAMVAQHQQRIEEIFNENLEQGYFWWNSFETTLVNSLMELRGEPDGHILTRYLSPIDFFYTIHWQMPDPTKITVRQREERLNQVQERIYAEEIVAYEGEGTLEEKSAYMVEACERICRELSDEGMTVSASDVWFKVSEA